MKRILAVLFLAFLPLTAHASAPPLTTHTYKTVGGLPLRADVYRPDNRGGRPIVVWIHGGGLILGSRRALPEDQRRLYLQSGYVVVSIDYRLAPETKLPGILEDLGDAWAWVRAHAAEIGGDPARVAVVGQSAGGHLALAAGQRLRPAPRAIVSFYGYGDLAGGWYATPDTGVKGYNEADARGSVGSKPLAEGNDDRRDIFSMWARQAGRRPQEIVGTEGEGLVPFSPRRNVGPLFPPTLLLHGDADTTVPLAQARQMAEALAGAGVPHRLRILPGSGHAFDFADRALGQRDVAEAFGDVLVFLSQWLGSAPPVADPGLTAGRQERLSALVEANVQAVHSFQVGLARKSGQGEPGCWSAETLDDAGLQSLEAHQASLLRQDVAAVRAWVEGLPSSFDPARDVEPLRRVALPLAPALPLSLITDDFTTRAAQTDPAGIRALANLYQTIFEVERDGDRLQELFSFYIALGLPVSVAPLGLPGTDADFLAWGESQSPKACASPFGTSPPEWQIAGRKIWNWREKHLHLRDAGVLAAELLEEPEVEAFRPRLSTLGPRRIVVIGHSFTMGQHWASPSAFVPIATEVFRRENPKVVVRQFEGGGLTSTRGEKFLPEALAFKPDTVLLVVANRTDQDLLAFDRIGKVFKDAGAQVYWFDDVEDPQTRKTGQVERNLVAARAAGMTVVEVGSLLERATGHDRFLCLDGIHMTEPWHRLMAKQWLALLVGARGPALTP